MNHTAKSGQKQKSTTLKGQTLGIPRSNSLLRKRRRAGDREENEQRKQVKANEQNATPREISRVAKIRRYRTMVRMTVVYGCETWVLMKKR
jgi:hypothetical protein